MNINKLLSIGVLLVLVTAVGAVAKSATVRTESPRKYLIILDDIFDYAGLQQEMAGLDRFAARDFVPIRYGEERRRVSDPLLRFLRPYLQSGEVMESHAFWIAPAISVTCVPAMTALIKMQPHVLEVVEDSLQQLLPAPIATPLPLKGPLEAEVPPNVIRLNARQVWALGYTGHGVLVGGYDSGIRTTQVDIVRRLYSNLREIPDNGIDDDGNGYVDDYHGFNFVGYNGNTTDDDIYSPYHGTHTAGTIAGDGAYTETTGVAPGATIMAVKILNSTGSGQIDNVLSALQYGILMHLDVINMSAGWDTPSNTIRNLMRHGLGPILDAGIVVCASAGNTGTSGIRAPGDISSPADVPAPWYGAAGHGPVLTIGSVDGAGNHSAYSSYGPAAWGSSDFTDYPYAPGLLKPDLMAFGDGVRSLYGGTDSGYATMSGTSMASPAAAGVVALLLSKNPLLAPREVDSILEFTAIDHDPVGRDSIYGAGQINALAAIMATPEVTVPIITFANYNILGDSVLSSGSPESLTVALHNYGADAAAVLATLSSSSPYISIISTTGSYGDLPRGDDAVNSGSAYSLSILSTAPPIFNIPFSLRITANGGYSRDDPFQVTAGLRNRATGDHDNGTIAYTVTNFGAGGFYDANAATPLGQGFTYRGYDYLWMAQLYISIAPNQVWSGENGAASDFRPASVMRISIPGSIADEDGSATYAYLNVATGLPIVSVKQKSYSWNAAGRNKFVIVQYQVKNWTDAPLTSLYIGMYDDWDVHLVNSPRRWYDRGAWSPSARYGYMYDNAVPPVNTGYVGLAALDSNAHGSLVNNQQYVYPSPGLQWTDSVKYGFLADTYHSDLADSNGDYSMLAAVGPISLDSGATIKVAFAQVCGDNLSEFQANALESRHLYDSLGLASVREPRNYVMGLDLRVYPSPSSGSVTIAAPGLGHMEIQVWDLSGRRLARLQPTSTGLWRWDGNSLRGVRATPGIYLLKTDSGEILGKIVLDR